MPGAAAGVVADRRLRSQRMLERVSAIRRANLVAAPAALAFSLFARPGASQDASPPPEQIAPGHTAPEQTVPAEQAPQKDSQRARDEQIDKLVAELLGESQSVADDDLRWLYSDVSEYAPSELVGKPIPALVLPERGEGSRRAWNPTWRRFGFGNYVVTGLSLAIAGGSYLLPVAPDRWRGRNRLDEAVRDAIGVENYESGQLSRDASDIALTVLVSYPLLVDSMVVMYWYRQSKDVAGEMALITSEALAVTAAAQGLIAGLTSRERPYGRNCNDPALAPLDDCRRSQRYRSFFSSHTSLAFTGAAVSCTHHVRHSVYGDPAADAISCAAGFVTAGVVGTLRIVGDRHYFSDVLGGAALGTIGGLYIPWLFHYGTFHEPKPWPGPAQPLSVGLVPTPGGLGVGGTF